MRREWWMLFYRNVRRMLGTAKRKSTVKQRVKEARGLDARLDAAVRERFAQVAGAKGKPEDIRRAAESFKRTKSDLDEIARTRLADARLDAAVREKLVQIACASWANFEAMKREAEEFADRVALWEFA